MDAPDPAYVVARSVLLDALTALQGHLPSIILVGAQAVYLRTPNSRIRSAPFTTDGDLAIDPRELASEPELESAMAGAGFTLQPPGRQPQPGLWFKSVSIDGLDTHVEVDLLVPSASIPHGTERGARLLEHSRQASRLVSGLEATLVDHSILPIMALEDAGDQRVVSCNVAGSAALIVAKLHKLRDRLVDPSSDGHRLADKDAGDVVRLMLAVESAVAKERFDVLSEDSLAGPVVIEARRLLRDLFGGRRSPGTEMAIRALAVDLQPSQVEVVCQAFVEDVSR